MCPDRGDKLVEDRFARKNQEHSSAEESSSSKYNIVFPSTYGRSEKNAGFLFLVGLLW